MLTKCSDMVGIRGNQGRRKPWSFCIGQLHTETCLLGDFVFATPLPSPVLMAAAGFCGLYCQKDKLSCQGNVSEREERWGPQGGGYPGKHALAPHAHHIQICLHSLRPKQVRHSAQVSQRCMAKMELAH